MSTSPQRAAQASDPTHAPSTDLRRRRFLLALGAGSATAAAAAAQTLTPAVETTATPEDQSSKGYRETEHVRDYYASARL